MTFLLDENFPRAAIPLLARYGHLGQSVLELLPQATDDRGVFQAAQERGAVLLTTDKDFFHTVPLLFKEHAGVVVIALHQPNREKLLRRMEWVLRWMRQADLAGRALLVTDYHHLVG